jgi:hypothetical protein
MLIFSVFLEALTLKKDSLIFRKIDEEFQLNQFFQEVLTIFKKFLRKL